MRYSLFHPDLSHLHPRFLLKYVSASLRSHPSSSLITLPRSYMALLALDSKPLNRFPTSVSQTWYGLANGRIHDLNLDLHRPFEGHLGSISNGGPCLVNVFP